MGIESRGLGALSGTPLGEAALRTERYNVDNLPKMEIKVGHRTWEIKPSRYTNGKSMLEISTPSGFTLTYDLKSHKLDHYGTAYVASIADNYNSALRALDSYLSEHNIPRPAAH